MIRSLLLYCFQKPVYRILFSALAVLNIVFFFIDRFMMLSVLGTAESVVGIILAVTSIMVMFRAKGHVLKKILGLVVSLVLTVVSLLLCSMTVYPQGISTWMRANLMHAENVSQAQRSESTVADGSRLLSDVRYDTERPNGFLDIYYSAAPLEDRPLTAIFLHGGGYIWGDKANGDPNAGGTSFETSTCAALLAHGYNVVQMNYCLMPEYPYPEAILQLNRGLAYLKDHALELDLIFPISLH